MMKWVICIEYWLIFLRQQNIIIIIFILMICACFPNNMLWMDFSPLACCCIYGVCTRGVQILRTRRSSCGTPIRLRRQMSSVNSILVMIRNVVEHEL